MMQGNNLLKELYSGLSFIMAASFPKRCANCGAVFETADDFLERTRAAGGASGLKESSDEDERPLVEVFRNCTCGSTLMEVCADRRDVSPAGLARREKFSKLMTMLEGAGIEASVARLELLKVMRGEPSALLENIGLDAGNIRFEGPKSGQE